MFRGTRSRQYIVSSQINQLPAFEKSHVLPLYTALDSVEYARVVHWYYGLAAMILGPVIARFFGPSYYAYIRTIEWMSMHDLTEWVQTISILIMFTLLYLIGVLFAKMFLKQRLEKTIADAKDILSKTPQQAVNTLKHLDPDLEGNVGDILAF